MPYRLRTLLIVLALGPPAFAYAPLTRLVAAEVGGLTMHFVVDGKSQFENPPNTDQTLIVNKANRGIQNVCVWLMRRPGDLFSIDEEGQPKRPNRVVSITQGSFSPRIVILRAPQTLEVRNNDGGGYNICGDCSASNEPFCALLKPGGSFEKLIPFREDYPFRLRDTIHPSIGYVLALDQPHAGISDKDGTLTINGVPKGNWPFLIWHERCGRIKRVAQAGQPVEAQDGQFWFTIQPDNNSVQEFAIEPDLLRLK